MSSPGWMVFFLCLFLTNLIIGNVFSGELQPVTVDDTELLGDTANYPITEESSTSGSVVAFFNVTGNVFRLIGRALIADYDFFYDYDVVTGARTPNETYIFRYYFLLINFALFVTIGFLIWGRG